MKTVRAQFRPPWRPRRRIAIGFGLLTAAALATASLACWQRYRMQALQGRIAELEQMQIRGAPPRPPRPVPIYAESAAAMLRERAAAWAPMLRSLENADVPGVLPTLVQFNALDGSALAELAYGDPAALFDYLSRLNAGLTSRESPGHWSLVQWHVQAGAQSQISASAPPPAPGLSNPTPRADFAAASIRSDWNVRPVQAAPASP